MNYTKERLEEIEKYASVFLPISDIAIILGIPAEKLREEIKDRESDISKAYYHGKVSAKVKLHIQEMQLAQVGSPLALENAAKNLLDMEDDE